MESSNLQKKNYKGAAIASWVLIGLICLIALIPGVGFLTWIVGLPILLITFILGIVILSKGGTAQGVLILLTSLIFAPVFLVVAPILSTFVAIATSSAKAKSEKEHSAILLFDTEGNLRIDYEGSGYRQTSQHTDTELEFRAIHLDGRDWEQIHDESLADASFKGTYLVSGDDERDFTLELSIENKVPFTIRLMGIAKKGGEPESEFFEQRFPPGSADFTFEGTIRSYYERK